MRGALALTTAALVAILVVAVNGGTLDERRIIRETEDSLDETGRYVDFGIRLRVVRADLEHGEELVEGSPPLVVLRTWHLGGLVDTQGKRPSLCGKSRNPTDWYCSEDAEPLILHGDDLPGRLLVYGSEGAGKTRALAQWLLLRVLEATGTGHIIGVTSPTEPRAEEVREAIAEMCPPSWWKWNERRRTYTFRNGCRVQVRSTHQQSKEAGSRLQSLNWRAAASDEIQDSLKTDPDIEMRGRKAPRGKYKRFCTATSKDSSDFRTWRDKRLAGKLWAKRTLLGTRSPFVWPEFWDEKAETLDKREYRRRVLAEDLPPENRVYYGFERERNLIPLPEVARDVSREVLGTFRPIRARDRHGGFALLAGHDPGEIRNVTTFLRPYLYRDQILWVVVDRLITERTTAEQHAAAVKRHVVKHHRLNREPDRRDPDDVPDRVLIMCDPHGRGETKTDYNTVYQAFIDAGLDCFNAAGGDEVIQGEARRQMVNRLLDPEVGLPRLVVAILPDGTTAAPELVAAFEQLERDDRGKAEKGRKNEHDQTHHPVSVGYALWPFESPAVTAITRRRALVRGVV